MTQIRYSAGDVIFKQGESSNYVCRVVAGEVEVHKELDGRNVELGRIKAGEFVGEMGVLEGRPRGATVSAVADSTLEMIEPAEFLSRISGDRTAVLTLLVRMSERLNAINQAFAELAAHTTAGGDTTPEDWLSLAPAASEQAAPQVPTARVTMTAMSPAVLGVLGEQGQEIDRFPFTVGRRPEAGETAPSIHIDLVLPDSKPYRLSRAHFRLEWTVHGFVVRDLGSALGTQVNDILLGRDFARDSTPLQVGGNYVRAGGVDSPFAFRIVLEDK